MCNIQQNIIIVAGGVGKRMDSDIPKQFILLKSKPILMHTIRCFHNYNNAIKIIVVLPKNQVKYWQELCEKHQFEIKHQVVVGGVERFYSVKNGLVFVEKGVVGIHDGVRPLVSKNTIKMCFETVIKSTAVIPVLPIYETIREVEKTKSRTVNREAYKTVQTPQCFDVETIKKAYEQPFEASFTDDASVAEKWGEKIVLVSGNRENIKITTPSDLKIATALFDSIHG